MADIFEGQRNDNFSLVNDLKQTYEDVRGIVDSVGIKKANVYLMEKRGEDNIWKQILPSPSIRYDHRQKLLEGGETISGNIILESIPITLYEEQDLRTDSDEAVEKYFVINGRGYTVESIEREYLSWVVRLRLYEPVQDLVPPR